MSLYLNIDSNNEMSIIKLTQYIRPMERIYCQIYQVFENYDIYRIIYPNDGLCIYLRPEVNQLLMNEYRGGKDAKSILEWLKKKNMKVMVSKDYRPYNDTSFHDHYYFRIKKFFNVRGMTYHYNWKKNLYISDDNVALIISSIGLSALKLPFKAVLVIVCGKEPELDRAFAEHGQQSPRLYTLESNVYADILPIME